MCEFGKISEIFWSPSFWLPPGASWPQTDSRSPGDFPDPRHLVFVLPLTIVLIIMRHALEKYLFNPAGCYLGIKTTKYKYSPNSMPEKASLTKRHWNEKGVAGLTKQPDWQQENVTRWFQFRQAASKASTLQKFSACFWRATYYLSAILFGLLTLWNKPWFWRVNKSLENYPYQISSPSLHSPYGLHCNVLPLIRGNMQLAVVILKDVSWDIWWYYMISLAYYASWTISELTEQRKKDFWLMLVHHALSAFLLTISWISQLHRIGSLVIFVHDCSSYPLEVAKMARYSKRENIFRGAFFLFAALWILTRLMCFPFLVYTLLNAVWSQLYPAVLILLSLLFGIFGLHILWTRIIFQVAFQIMNTDRISDIENVSSDAEISSDEDLLHES